VVVEVVVVVVVVVVNFRTGGCIYDVLVVVAML